MSDLEYQAVLREYEHKFHGLLKRLARSQVCSSAGLFSLIRSVLTALLLPVQAEREERELEQQAAAAETIESRVAVPEQCSVSPCHRQSCASASSGLEEEEERHLDEHEQQQDSNNLTIASGVESTAQSSTSSETDSVGLRRRRPCTSQYQRG